jgi:hypothetical protein
MGDSRAALCGGVPPGEIDEHPSHCPGRDCQEVQSILPVYVVGGNQTNERFMDERCRLDRVAGPVSTQAICGATFQLVVQNRRDASVRVLVACLPGTQQHRDLDGLGIWHGIHRRTTLAARVFCLLYGSRAAIVILFGLR